MMEAIGAAGAALLCWSLAVTELLRHRRPRLKPVALPRGPSVTWSSGPQTFDGILVDRDTGEVAPLDPRWVDGARLDRAIAEFDRPVSPRALSRDESGGQP